MQGSPPYPPDAQAPQGWQNAGYPQGPPPAPKSKWGVTCLVVALAMVPVLGIMAALAISGFRRYLASAKTSEAQNVVLAIARGQTAAYERTGALCGSAPSVPAAAPSGRKYQPSTAPGADFEHAAWQCLGFKMTMPMYYAYEVRVGSGYKGPARGATDPGPDGFEISAEGDLDADGVTSLFLLTGKVDAATQRVVISPHVDIFDERE